MGAAAIIGLIETGLGIANEILPSILAGKAGTDISAAVATLGSVLSNVQAAVAVLHNPTQDQVDALVAKMNADKSAWDAVKGA